jgi:GDP-4-dehydro-6-deoxy-D-mannose reductase
MWLTDELRARDCDVFGIDLQDTGRHPSVTYRKTDLLDAAAINALFAEWMPDSVYHLAGVSYIPDADRSPRTAVDTNISGAFAVLDGARINTPTATVLLVGSAKEYSDSVMSDGINETYPPQPTNFYGISKYANELIGQQYHRQFGLDVRCTRSFNHTGPGQSPRFVCSDWARQIALISLGRAEPFLTVGDLNATIDFSDVRDVVAAYCSIVNAGQPGEVYNVCSGGGVALSWIIDHLGKKSPIPIAVQYRDEKVRAHKANVKMIGDHSKLTSHTGWRPQIPFYRTLDDLFDWWLKELG